MSIFNISNLLTISRIFIAPFIVLGIFYNYWYLVFFLLVVAGLTDFFDGYLARKFNQGTVLGACLDPIADKILLVSTFSALAMIDSPSFKVPFWFVFFLFFREIIILGGTLFLFLTGKDFKVSPSIAGKMTTFFQLSFIFWIFACYFFGWNPIKTYSVLIVILALFSFISLFQYGMIGLRYFFSGQK